MIMAHIVEGGRCGSITTTCHRPLWPKAGFYQSSAGLSIMLNGKITLLTMAHIHVVEGAHRGSIATMCCRPLWPEAGFYQSFHWVQYHAKQENYNALTMAHIHVIEGAHRGSITTMCSRPLWPEAGFYQSSVGLSIMLNGKTLHCLP
jgi:hypothetical protein